MNFQRKSGVLLHISSLPGRWGMGELGPHARAFGEQLAVAGQSFWQILPTGPIGYGYSPYSSLSAFAGNALLISFDDLIEEGLLRNSDLRSFPGFNSEQIDFPAVMAAREKILFNMADRFEDTDEFTTFCKQEAGWLADYALFMAIRESEEFRPWSAWPAPLRDRKPAALKKARTSLSVTVRRHEVLQFIFFKQWNKLTEFLQMLDVSMIGDIPIFVAGDSVDVWANRELFFLNADGSPTVVAGVPPDYFSETGQRWGNPLYDWEAHRATKYAWWTQRMRRALQMTDVIRIDHFRGFEAYWEIPATCPTAIDGRWVKGPDAEFFQTVEKQLKKGSTTEPGLGKSFCLADHVIAENLGLITEEVEALREECGFPGMWVLQFRFGDEPMQTPGYVPEGTEVNWVVYTGTHDNDTTQGWLAVLEAHERTRIKRYLKLHGALSCRAITELTLNAPAKWAIIPFQDVLG
ncbi:MAG: 4-alpha-glucanotransferase, partial [Kiritimatiellaceae bacterium]|nr:4-alpha-glucanotransferase [Kiritimatiellaceae bacterium]